MRDRHKDTSQAYFTQMKLWGWWRKDDNKKKEEAEPTLLEDLPPAFEDHSAKKPNIEDLKLPSLSQTVGNIGVEDFKQLPQIPCFRNAMLTGLGIGATAASVMFVSKRVVSRSVNWGVGGFIIGSIITWEQCRFRMYRSRRNVEKAKALYRHRGENEGEGEPKKK